MAKFSFLLSIFVFSMAACVYGNDFLIHTKAQAEKEKKAEERGDLFQGDLIITEAKKRRLFGKKTKRDALVAFKWPGGLIPYVMDQTFAADATRVALLTKAIAEFDNKTCVKFRPRTTEANYVNMIIGQGCYSSLGRDIGAQPLSIGQGCEFMGTMIHEMMHAAGFIHEQSRPDRDNYIKINWNNIMEGMDSQFQKYSALDVNTFGEKYDFDSVMHYPNDAFSKNFLPTMEAKDDPYRAFGQRNDFSPSDIIQINKLYQCATCHDDPLYISDCPGWVSYCKGDHEDFMKQHCKRTCLLC